MSELILRHHGIKGMRWGVRRSPEELYRGDKEAFAIVEQSFQVRLEI